jgi:hypothetical protein
LEPEPPLETAYSAIGAQVNDREASTHSAAAASMMVRVPVPRLVPHGDLNLGRNAMSSKELTKAVAYFRTSSSTNVGAHKDSEKR